MEVENFSTTLKILEEFNFENSENVPERLKCLKCRKILRNACQVSCGCPFCLKCIEKLMIEGMENCFGDTEDCKSSNLKTYFLDNRANREILKLMLKCPVENCAIQCELVNMVEHLRLCPKKTGRCLFYEFGCNKSTSDSLEEHFLTEQENHNKIILDMVGALKNEINEKDGKNKMEIEMLKKELSEKDEEIQSLKVENRKMNDKIFEMNEKSRNCENVINSGLLKQTKADKDFRYEILNRMDKFEQHLKCIPLGNFKWELDQVRNQKKGEWILSKTFFFIAYPLKMKMRFCNLGKDFNIDVGFSQIISDNKKIVWPFIVKISIQIMNEGDTCVWAEDAGIFNFSAINQFKFLYLSKPFKFSYADSPFTFLNDKMDIVVECIVNLE